MPAWVRERKQILLALLSGLLLCLSFPSFACRSFAAWPGWLAWVSLVPLLAAIQGEGWKRAFRLGFCAGLVFFLCSLYWINYVRPMGIFATVAWILLGAYLALFPAAFAALTAAGTARRLPLPLLWPAALWTVLEFLRGTLFSGFPWNGLGASQFRAAWLLPLAASCGVYGLHFCVCLGNTLIHRLLTRPASLKPAVLWPVAAACAGLLLLGLAGSLGKDAGPIQKVAVIQGNVNQDQEWTPAYRAGLMSAYMGLMDQAAAQDAKLMIWPEGTFPGLFAESSPEARELRAFAARHGVDLLIGSDTADRSQGTFSNSALLLDPSGGLQEYCKQHLVPFGEFIPLRRVLPFVDMAVKRFGTVDFTAGEGPVVFRAGGGTVAPLICYEGIFPALVRRAETTPALLAVITFDTWYGDSAAPYQHASQAVLRAVENGCWLARAGATGISCFVSPSGRILKPVPLNTPGFAVQEVSLGGRPTLYQRWGDWFVWLCLVFLVGVGLARRLTPFL